MPVQTSKATDYVFIPDGTKVKADGVDLGTFNSDITAILNYDVNIVNSSNNSIIKRVGKNPTMTWAGTLIDLDPAGVALISGGMLTVETVAGSPFVDAPDQEIASGSWADVTPVNLVPTTLAGSAVRATALTLTSVTGDVDGALTADDDYTLITDSNSKSGYSILLNTAGTNLTTVAQKITVDYASVTPVASKALSGGSSTFEFEAFALEMEHTDDSGLKRTLSLPRCTPESGGFQFNFKSAQSDGSEEMPLTCTADLDTSLADGKQLFTWTIEEGAM